MVQTIDAAVDCGLSLHTVNIGLYNIAVYIGLWLGLTALLEHTSRELRESVVWSQRPGNYRRLKFNQRPENRLTATSKAIRWTRIRWMLSDAASHTLLVVNTACSKWVGLSRTVLFDKSSWESSRLLCDVFCTLHVPRSQLRRVKPWIHSAVNIYEPRQQQTPYKFFFTFKIAVIVA